MLTTFKKFIDAISALQEKAPSVVTKIDPNNIDNELQIDITILDHNIETISTTVSLAQGDIRKEFNIFEGNYGLLTQVVAAVLKNENLTPKLEMSQQQRGRDKVYYNNASLGRIFADSGEVSKDGAASRDDFATAIIDQYRSRLGGEALKKFKALEEIDASFAVVIPNLQKIKDIVCGVGEYEVWDSEDKQMLIKSTVAQITTHLEIARSLLQATLAKDKATKIETAIEKINAAIIEITSPKQSPSASVS